MLLVSGASATGAAQAAVIQYDSGTLQTSYSATWGYYSANRFTNELTVPVTVDALLIRSTPFGGAADAYFWKDDGGTPGEELGGPVFEWLDDTWQRVDVSSLGLTVPAGGSIFGGFEARSGAEYPYDNASPGVERSWWDELGDGDWTQGSPTGGTNNLMVRLEVTPVPEPSALVLLLGAFAPVLLVAASRPCIVPRNGYRRPAETRR